MVSSTNTIWLFLLSFYENPNRLPLNSAHSTWFCRKVGQETKHLTGFKPATSRLVCRHSDHCATAVAHSTPYLLWGTPGSWFLRSGGSSGRARTRARWPRRSWGWSGPAETSWCRRSWRGPWFRFRLEKQSQDYKRTTERCLMESRDQKSRFRLWSFRGQAFSGAITTYLITFDQIPFSSWVYSYEVAVIDEHTHDDKN